MNTINTDLVEKILLVNDKILKLSSEKIFKNTELTPIQFNILGQIIWYKGLLISQIKQKLVVSSPAISQILNRMEKSGFIKREISKKSRREIIITPTEKAISIYNQVDKKYVEISSDRLACLTDEEKKLIFKFLEKIEISIS